MKRLPVIAVLWFCAMQLCAQSPDVLNRYRYLIVTGTFDDDDFCTDDFRVTLKAKFTGSKLSLHNSADVLLSNGVQMHEILYCRYAAGLSGTGFHIRFLDYRDSMVLEYRYSNTSKMKCGALIQKLNEKLSVFENYTYRYQPITTPKVVADNIPPILKITNPQIKRGAMLSIPTSSFTISGIASDNTEVKEVRINNEKATLSNDGSFQRTYTLQNGLNIFKVIAADASNNTTEQKVSLEYNNTTGSVLVLADDTSTATEKRMALVIGNAAYRYGQSLKNTTNDAVLMSQTLEQMGFKVTRLLDATLLQMQNAIINFSKELPKHNVALFYYAGHGMEADGVNYLIPVDAKVEEKGRLRYEAINIDDVVMHLDRFPNNTNIVILDACRNNPFLVSERGAGRGFVAITPASGTIIGFATSPRQTASDGTEGNGLYTKELVQQMLYPQPIETVFKKTRIEVEKKSNYSQSPQEWSKLKGEFYFIK